MHPTDLRKIAAVCSANGVTAEVQLDGIVLKISTMTAFGVLVRRRVLGWGSLCELDGPGIVYLTEKECAGLRDDLILEHRSRRMMKQRQNANLERYAATAATLAGHPPERASDNEPDDGGRNDTAR